MSKKGFQSDNQRKAVMAILTVGAVLGVATLAAKSHKLPLNRYKATRPIGKMRKRTSMTRPLRLEMQKMRRAALNLTRRWQRRRNATT